MSPNGNVPAMSGRVPSLNHLNIGSEKGLSQFGPRQRTSCGPPNIPNFECLSDQEPLELFATSVCGVCFSAVVFLISTFDIF